MAKQPRHSAGEKHEALNKGLEGEYVMVHVNTLNDLLVIPEHLKAKSTVTLKISRWFRGAMELYEDRIEAELVFNGGYFNCSIPLSAIWGITDAKGRNTVWPGASPPEVLLSLLQPQLYESARKRRAKKDLEEKSEAAESSESTSRGKDVKKDGSPSRSHLRRIK